MTLSAVLRELMAAGLHGDALLAAVERIEQSDKPKRSAGAERTAKWREKKDTEERHSDVTASPGDSKKEKSPAPPKEKTTSSASNEASDGAGAPQAPLYTDSLHELWGEGVPVLVSLGVPDPSARKQIGRWLKDTKNDSQRVLGAIQRARDARVMDPFPWITRALQANGQSHGKTRTVQEAAQDLHQRVLGRIAEFDNPMPASGGDEGGGNIARLLPQRGCG